MGLSVVKEEKNSFFHLKSVPSSKSQNRSLFCVGRFWQHRIPTVPVLSERLHVFNIYCEWSPKILPPSINLYCLSGFATPSRKYPCSITHSLKYVSVKDTEHIKHVVPRERRLRQKETWVCFPTTVFTTWLVDCSPSLLHFSIQLPPALQPT